MNFYIFENKKMPWGDYGDVLLTGWAYPDESDRHKICIERTGPFVPPVYEWAKMLLVSETTKQQLEQSGLKGIGFIKAYFKKIVHIDWTKWDLNAENPEFYPVGQEPENYIEKKKHDPRIAEKMEPVWCLLLNEETLIGRQQRNVSHINELFIIENSWTGNDIFTGKGAGYIYFTEKAKKWFEENLGDYANFTAFQSKTATQDEIDFALEYIKPLPVKVDPFAHLTPKDWKAYQKHIDEAKKFIEKAKTAKTEKSKATNIHKALNSFKKAGQIRPLGKKEQLLYTTYLDLLTKQFPIPEK